MSILKLHYEIDGEDFTRAGEASASVKKRLRQLGVKPDATRKVSIALYEGEINIDQAMKEGSSTAPDEVRSLGFGAGMGLPNMKKNSDEMQIETVLGKGTTVTMAVYL